MCSPHPRQPQPTSQGRSHAHSQRAAFYNSTRSWCFLHLSPQGHFQLWEQRVFQIWQHLPASVFMSVPSQSAVISSLGNYLKQLNRDCPFLMSPATVPPLLTHQLSGQREEWRPSEPPSPEQGRLDLVHLQVCFLRILWTIRWKLLASFKNHSQPSNTTAALGITHSIPLPEHCQQLRSLCFDLLLISRVKENFFHCSFLKELWLLISYCSLVLIRHLLLCTAQLFKATLIYLQIVLHSPHFQIYSSNGIFLHCMIIWMERAAVMDGAQMLWWFNWTQELPKKQIFSDFDAITQSHRSLQILARNMRWRYDLLKYSKLSDEESVFLFHRR